MSEETFALVIYLGIPLFGALVAGGIGLLLGIIIDVLISRV